MIAVIFGGAVVSECAQLCTAWALGIGAIKLETVLVYMGCEVDQATGTE